MVPWASRAAVKVKLEVDGQEQNPSGSHLNCSAIALMPPLACIFVCNYTLAWQGIPSWTTKCFWGTTETANTRIWNHPESMAEDTSRSKKKKKSILNYSLMLLTMHHETCPWSETHFTFGIHPSWPRRRISFSTRCSQLVFSSKCSVSSSFFFCMWTRWVLSIASLWSRLKVA